MWVVCAHEAIGQSLELAFQMIFAGAVTIRHRGSAESIDGVGVNFQNGTGSKKVNAQWRGSASSQRRCATENSGQWRNVRKGSQTCGLQGTKGCHALSFQIFTRAADET
ncbi:hypothetical protein K443DRAFT_156092 [Laccaria amethystina LaAM-08-1]|uniref:Unplaced genomic scaffold K443scaffold_1012, whole genome shotgun sequence n=1 Tax=Laccaria amethystina LaAM-08-1 TaxID=1095629 RepID=A0A0C9WYX9_9AGAR|nr:hypothetical protein K443DRAFT_156092 [Laccaria amethystina LaAM-08-1]